MTKWLLVLISFVCFGCNFRLLGTNTGNPDFNSAPAIGYEGALLLGDTVCNKIKSCYAGADITACNNQILTFAGYTSELGATAASFSTLAGLRAAENNAQVSVNGTNFSNCIQTVQNLNCLDSLVQNGYSQAAPTNYRMTNILFRSSGACTQIY